MDIQGQVPDSQNELNVAQALNTLKIEYVFQYDIMGGKGRRGGQVIDFLLYTSPLFIPLQVQGAYWHGKAMSKHEALELYTLEEYAQNQGWDRPVELYEEETATYEAALIALKQKVGYG